MLSVVVPEEGSSEVLDVRDVPRPEPSPDQVLIETEAIGVNFADIMQRRGTYFDGPDPPYRPGFEAVGRIVEVGENSHWDVGERVTVNVDPRDENGGAYAEYVLAPTDGLLPVPDDMPAAEAAGFSIQFLTAHNVLHGWGELAANESVLVHAAAGGVGSAAVQLAREEGAEIFATASTEAKLDLASELGADHCINYTEVDFAEVIDDRTNGRGVDLVLDGVGGPTLEKSIEVLAGFGRVVTYGTASGQHEVNLDSRSVFFENKRIIGYHLGHGMENDPDRVQAASSNLMSLLFGGQIDVLIDEEFPLSEVRAAHDYIEDRRNIGKVVLKP